MFVALTALSALTVCAGADDQVLADFEGPDYGDWEVVGEAFGDAPASGTLAGQQAVTGFHGTGLANSFRGGDATVGTLTSPAFLIGRPYINFLVGGGYHPGETCIRLEVRGRIVHSTTGANHERLVPHTWDVRRWRGSRARIVITDTYGGSWGHINVDEVVQSDRALMRDYGDDRLTHAMASVVAGTERAQADPLHPVFHVAPPAFWINDPNAPLYYGGQYHLFYQFNPYDDRWGFIHWGHVSSRDLVHWEQMPIALFPRTEYGEDHCWSGGGALDQSGNPLLFYTSIGAIRPAGDGAVQCLAYPKDPGLVAWEQLADDPVLTEQIHGREKIREWRDPFLFRHEGRTFMVLGGYVERRGRGVVTLYRAKSRNLRAWDYMGILFERPEGEEGTIECPNLFPLGDDWILIISRGGGVDHFVGDLDTRNWLFTPRHRLAFTHQNYYAPTSMVDTQGRRILWGWVSGLQAPSWESGRGWNGCLTLPRVLSVGPDGALCQEPLPELRQLRGPLVDAGEVALDSRVHVVEAAHGDTLEIMAEIDRGTAERVGLRILGSAEIAYDGRTLKLLDSALPLALGEDETLKLHVFVDRSLVEVYANGGRACLTRVIRPEGQAQPVACFAEGGAARVTSLKIWEMHSIW